MVKIAGTIRSVSRKSYMRAGDPVGSPGNRYGSGPWSSVSSGDVDVEMADDQKFHFKNTAFLGDTLKDNERVALHVYAPLLRYRRIIGVTRAPGLASVQLPFSHLILRLIWQLVFRPLYMWIPIALVAWVLVSSLPGMADLGSMLTTDRDPSHRVTAVAIQLGFIGAYAMCILSAFRLILAYRLMKASPGID